MPEHLRKAMEAHEAGVSFSPVLVDDVTEPVPDMLIDGWLVKGSLAAIYGKSDTYKSYMALTMALSVAYGLPFMDVHDVEQGAVLILDSENHGSIVKQRKDAYDSFHGQSKAPIHLWADDYNITDPAYEATLIEYVVQHDIRLVLLDMLADLAGDMTNENDTQDSTMVSKVLRRIVRETGATVLFVHHTNDGGTWRGNKKLKGACDTRIKLEYDPTKSVDGVMVEMRQRMCVNERKRLQYQPIQVDLGDRTNIVMRPVAAPVEVGRSNDQRIMDAVDHLCRYKPDDWDGTLTPEQLIDESGVKKSTLYRRLKVLKERGVMDERNRRPDSHTDNRTDQHTSTKEVQTNDHED